jgi:hypothetical protein
MLFSQEQEGTQSENQGTRSGSEYYASLFDVFSRSNSRAVDMLFSAAKRMDIERSKGSKFNEIMILSEV